MNLASFYSVGYQVIPNVVPEITLAPLLAFLEREASRSDESETVKSGHFPLATRLSDTLQEAILTFEIKGFLGEIFPNQQLCMHLPPMARFVSPGNQMAMVPPHQDISYNKHLEDFVVVWIPLTPIDDECGGVCVHKASHTLDEQLTNLSRDVWLEGIPDQGFEKEHCHMNAGDALLFHKQLIHESMPNKSSRTRYSLDLRFFGSNSRSTKPFLNLDR